MSAEIDKIKAIARDHNVGDVALGLEPNTTRDKIGNIIAMPGNICSMDVINKAHPEENYQFAWVPFGDSNYFQDLKDVGYKPVIEGEWVVERWEWYKPHADRDRWRWDVQSMLVYRDQFLMFRDVKMWANEMAKRFDMNADSIASRYSSDIESSQRVIHDQGLGNVQIEGKLGGKEFEGKPTRRKSVI
jgi:hypothetical protein